MELTKEPLADSASFQHSESAQFLGSEKGKFENDLLGLFVEFFCRQRPLFLKELIENLEKCIILDALARERGNQKEAAKALGLKYTTLNEKVKRYNIRFQKRPVGYSYQK